MTKLMNVTVNGFLIPLTPLAQMPATDEDKKEGKNETRMAYQGFVLSPEEAMNLYEMKEMKARKKAEAEGKQDEKKKEDVPEEKVVNRYSEFRFSQPMVSVGC